MRFFSGSWRHHDLIPYDDDVDFLVSFDHKTRLFQQINSSAVLSHVIISGVCKIYFAGASKAGKHKWNWPFLDIWFYRENRTHIWYDGDDWKSLVIKKLDVFPLVLRPLGTVWIPSPRNYTGYHSSIRKDTNDSTLSYCIQNGYSHRTESQLAKVTVRCTELMNAYPFVMRTCTQVKCLEELKLGHQTLYILRVDNGRTFKQTTTASF
ncbi:unnamed protein product [Didymodactylos carnosus]|uniref:Uncharacterized protein n=1 Tax=Didymodactylos carnosus TaxID=1234261 RepID=A0A814LSB0_9BILA|nr:unnamed protein product [Didymodactylos carnosus]CAF1382321.1 unnamed protein product [Didymodactylos carnosus]CAF3836777.1 unnamed protein product [Didymodactylos carnosus]CAF4190650.1 unnamed protein product [Didymodactylos carnosus]